jgi:hypothetical protein
VRWGWPSARASRGSSASPTARPVFAVLEGGGHYIGPVRLEAVPLALDYCRTRLADTDEAAWVLSRFAERCALFGTEVAVEGGRAVIGLSGSA